MTDAIEQNLWYKIRYTPIRDMLRGKLTARLDLRRPLEESALPPQIKQLLHRVVKATRLWRLEQLEVQQELIAHFTDGIASGVSPDQLVKAFGDEQQAAELIRRAKRRNRPLAWYALRFAAWSTVAMLVFYFTYAIYFFTGRPSPRINYVAIVNSTVEKTPVEDRAWTFYRRALIGTNFRNDGSLQRLNQLIRDERQAELAEFVRTHQSQIASIHEGATKSEFGWVIGSKGSVNDAELWPNQSVPAVDEGTESLALAALPPLMGLRYMATMLRADAIVAGNAGDSKRLLQDIHSTLSLSKQVGKDAPLLLGLMSIAISEMAIEDVERTLREHPTLIRKEELIELSRRLSSPKVAADLFSLDAERMSFDDMLQRAYTDDGSGSGRLTSEALTDYALFDYPPRKSRWWETAAQPAISLLAPSRRKFKEEYTQGMDMAESNLKLALREANWPGAHEVPLSPFSAAWAMPSLHRSQDGAERTLGHRDGVVTGIALELYRREHGNYPDSLDALVPELLPEVPIDRITGAPVRYGRVDGRPVVYSVGPDRKDDNGREPDPPKRAGYWDANPEVMPDGDWVLYTTLKR